jgi:hypothetical protein
MRDSTTVKAPATARPPTAQQAPDAARVLGRYRLHRRLGAGAFGTVWLARDERLDRDVAVKVVERERIVGGRFAREARAAARLKHPGIVTLYEAGADDEGAYLVSELVRGDTLDRLLSAGRLSDRDLIAIGIALCRALAHAHASGVVHRDIKPSNILVPSRPATPEEVAKLTDFGVARVVGGDTLTRTGDVVGTAAYMAPEQAEGREAGVAADLYSLAVVLYEALTGVNPVRASRRATAGGVRRDRLSAHAPPLRRQRRDLPRELAQAIDRALRPRPRERGTVEDLERALLAVREQAGDQAGVVAPARVPLTRVAAEDLLDPIDGDEADDGPPRTRLQRLVAAAAAALIAGWLLAHELPGAPVPPAAGALAAAIAVVALPRLGWALVALVLSAAVAAAGHAGAALLLPLAAAVPAVLAPLRPLCWPLAAAAPLIGWLGLGGAWPALAARTGSATGRAALGATGWVWLLVAETLSGRHLYAGPVPHQPASAAWTGSLEVTVHDVLAPLLRSGILTPALVWAGAAVVLPWLVRGRSLPLDLVAVTIWSALTAAATASVLHASAPLRHATIRDAALGAVVGAAATVAGRAASVLRDGLRASGSRPELA